jgi:hypothetical protein
MIYVTNGVTHDGFGARFQRVIQLIGLVEYMKHDLNLNVEYIHTPFSYIWSGEDYQSGYLSRKGINPYPYDDITIDGYINRAKLWDDKVKFNGSVIQNYLHTIPTVKYGYNQLINDLKNNVADNNLYVIKTLHKEYDSKQIDINIIKKYRDNILSKFNIESINKNHENIKSVSIHIRTKDALNQKNINHRYLDYKYYNDFIKLFNYDNKYDVKIYTQKIGFDETQYSGCNIIYDDIEDDYETFINLIFSDYLIVAKSSFSYSTALLNNNTVVYHDQGHIKIDSWLTKEQLINKLKNE